MQNNLLKNKASNPAVFNPIGVMDSGVGGISVLKHIHALLPHENLFYVADSQYAPYGSMTPEEITARCLLIADFLIAQGVKAIVVACNTATAASIATMREKYTLPIIGMEPAVKPAAMASKNGVVGVLATVGTLKSAQFAALLENYGRDVKVITQGCTGLVECIERGELNAANTQQLLKQYCAPLLAEGADTIVLGCTHYPLIKNAIRKVVEEGVSIVDTGAAVASHLKSRLEKENLLSDKRVVDNVCFWTNSEVENAVQVIEILWGAKADIKRLD